MDVFVEIIKQLVLGLVSGITSILPVSRDGHFMLLSYSFGYEMSSLEPLKIVINCGIIIAIILFFYREIARTISGTWKYLIKREDTSREDAINLAKIFVVVIPASLVIIFLEDYVNNLISLLSVGFAFIITATILGFIFMMKDIQWKENLSWRNTILISILPMFSIIPGISYSALFQEAGLSQKVNMRKVLRFGFISYGLVLLITSIVSAATVSWEGFGTTNIQSLNPVGFILAFLFAFGGCLAALYFMMRKVTTKHYVYFAGYALAIGILSIVVHFVL